MFSESQLKNQRSDTIRNCMMMHQFQTSPTKHPSTSLTAATPLIKLLLLLVSSRIGLASPQYIIPHHVICTQSTIFIVKHQKSLPPQLHPSRIPRAPSSPLKRYLRPITDYSNGLFIADWFDNGDGWVDAGRGV
ncbi:hypothetical protein AKJ16_DCAP08385 [Drosera capensis]